MEDLQDIRDLSCVLGLDIRAASANVVGVLSNVEGVDLNFSSLLVFLGKSTNFLT